MKIKVNKHKLNIHYRGSPWGSRTQQHAYCLRYAHSQHIESHLGKKQQQAKIPIAFLFSQLHFNNVTSHALFYGGHLVMRSNRCTVQNQGITLKIFRRTLSRIFSKTSPLGVKLSLPVCTAGSLKKASLQPTQPSYKAYGYLGLGYLLQWQPIIKKQHYNYTINKTRFLWKASCRYTGQHL